MSRDTIIEQARLIYKTTTLMRDWIWKIQASDACGMVGYYEFTSSQLHAMLATHEAGQVTMTKLARILNVSPPSASAMVDRLVEKGLLVREHSTKDRRKVVVSVSKDAIKAIEEVENKILKSIVDLAEKLGPETTRKWYEVFECIKRELEEQ